MEYKNVLITGVHTGLGYALVKVCLGYGMRVYGLSRSPPEDLIEQEALSFARLDLRQFDLIPGICADLLEGIEQLDLVVLNAGVLGPIQDLSESSLAELREVMDVNVWANKILIDALLGGDRRVIQVVAVSSGAALNGSGGWGAYAISKSALNLLIRVYADEHPNTHFTALAPGIIDTPMLRHVLVQPEDPRYPANTRIREALAESRVNPAGDAAELILTSLLRLQERPSGTYVDLRQI